MTTPTPQVKERDLAVAAWYSMHGLELHSARRFGEQGFEFTFNDPAGRADDLRITFANSEAARYDAAVRTLKKLVMNGRARQGKVVKG